MADREPLLLENEIVESGTSSITTSGTDVERVEDVTSESQALKSAAILNAQGHKAEMERSFSPFAALGLGFRYITYLIEAIPRLSHHH